MSDILTHGIGNVGAARTSLSQNVQAAWRPNHFSILHIFDDEKPAPDGYATMLDALMLEQKNLFDESRLIRWGSANRNAHILLASVANADVVHVHGGGEIYHFLARTKARHKKPLIATLWPPYAKGVVRIMRSSRNYGYIATTSELGTLKRHLGRREGVGFFDVHGYAPIAALEMRKIYEALNGSDLRSILGLRIPVSTNESAISLLDGFISKQAPAKVAFANANLALISARNDAVRAALADFILLNDGVGINMASRLLYGRQFPQNLNGTDFVPSYLDQSKHSLRIFLLGARPHVNAKARIIFQERWPRHTIVGNQHGYFSAAEASAITEKIRATEADIVLVAMGNPSQEIWAAHNIPAAAPIAVCVGALFDFVAGEVSRAPAWIRALRLEWSYRMMLEPRRLWKRYTLEIVGFFRYIFGQLISGARA